MGPDKERNDENITKNIYGKSMTKSKKQKVSEKIEDWDKKKENLVKQYKDIIL